MPKLIKTEELAKILDVHPNTIRAYAASGRIPFIKLSERDYRYDLEKVLEHLRGDK